MVFVSDYLLNGDDERVDQNDNQQKGVAFEDAGWRITSFKVWASTMHVLLIPTLDLEITAVSIYLKNIEMAVLFSLIVQKKIHIANHNPYSSWCIGAHLQAKICVFSSLLVLILLLNNWRGGEKAVCTSIKVGLLVIFTFWWDITRFFHFNTLKPSISNHLNEKKTFLSGIKSSVTKSLFQKVWWVRPTWSLSWDHILLHCKRIWFCVCFQKSFANLGMIHEVHFLQCFANRFAYSE